MVLCIMQLNINYGGNKMSFEMDMAFYLDRNRKTKREAECLREYWDGNQIKLSPSHADCPNCYNYEICPDPTVITMRNRI